MYYALPSSLCLVLMIRLIQSPSNPPQRGFTGSSKNQEIPAITTPIQFPRPLRRLQNAVERSDESTIPHFDSNTKAFKWPNVHQLMLDPLVSPSPPLTKTKSLKASAPGSAPREEWKDFLQDSDSCQRCHRRFGRDLRKHHCHNCGKCVCYLCSDRTFLISRFGVAKQLRVDEDCFEQLTKSQGDGIRDSKTSNLSVSNDAVANAPALRVAAFNIQFPTVAELLGKKGVRPLGIWDPPDSEKKEIKAPDLRLPEEGKQISERFLKPGKITTRHLGMPSPLDSKNQESKVPAPNCNQGLPELLIGRLANPEPKSIACQSCNRVFSALEQQFCCAKCGKRICSSCCRLVRVPEIGEDLTGVIDRDCLVELSKSKTQNLETTSASAKASSAVEGTKDPKPPPEQRTSIPPGSRTKTLAEWKAIGESLSADVGKWARVPYRPPPSAKSPESSTNPRCSNCRRGFADDGWRCKSCGRASCTSCRKYFGVLTLDMACFAVATGANG
jgi:FYVE zinc finger